MPLTEDCLEYNAVCSSLTASTFSSWFLSDHQIAANWGLHTVVSCWFHFTKEDEWQLKAWSSGNFELCVEKENTRLSRWWREVSPSTGSWGPNVNVLTYKRGTQQRWKEKLGSQEPSIAQKMSSWGWRTYSYTWSESLCRSWRNYQKYFHKVRIDPKASG